MGLAGPLAAPTAATILAGTAGLLATAALSSAVAVGLSALIGSRGPVIAIVLAFNLAIAQMLVGISFLGDVRQAIPTVALARIGHANADVHTTLGVAVAVAAAWVVGRLRRRRMAHQRPARSDPRGHGAGDTLSACSRPCPNGCDARRSARRTSRSPPSLPCR